MEFLTRFLEVFTVLNFLVFGGKWAGKKVLRYFAHKRAMNRFRREFYSPRPRKRLGNHGR